ncbi:MAG: hypothetical protein ACREPT_14970 [Rudaea sp.]
MLPIPLAQRAARNPLRLILALLVLSCAGCDRSSSTLTAALPSAEGGVSAAVPRYVIQFPELGPELATLDHALHVYADDVRRKFDADLATRRDAGAPAQLSLQFAVATRTQDFVSVVASGETDLGDAHARPLAATFTEHLPSAKIVALDDLFGDPAAAMQLLSTEARRRFEADAEARLRQQNLPDAQLAERLQTMRAAVERGTVANPQNFSAFLIDGVDGKAIGLSLQFEPGQVATSAQGVQQLEVPAKIFYAMLKTEYQDGFAVDKEDIQSAEPRSASTY